jgi:hypothetical protein
MDHFYVEWRQTFSIQDLTSDDTNNGFDHNHHIMQTIVQQGMVLIYQGGGFVWPRVRIGFERCMKLQVPITINNSISTADDTWKHYYYVIPMYHSWIKIRVRQHLSSVPLKLSSYPPGQTSNFSILITMWHP